MNAETAKILSEICNIIRQTVSTERIYLFGSHAYGTPTEESDFDLFVVIPDSALRPIDAMVSIQDALYRQHYRMPIDVLASRVSSFQTRRQSATLERTIFTKGVLLYERPADVQRMA